MPTMPTKLLQVRLPAVTWWELRLKSGRTGIPVRVILAQAVAAHVGEEITRAAGLEVLLEQPE